MSRVAAGAAMGIYGNCVLPHLIDLAMKHPLARERRMEVVPRATGVVLEIGIGSGLNLQFYTSGTTALYGVDPSERLLSMARARSARSRVAPELVCASAEQLPVPSASIDSVVMTWTLCSIPAPARALAEIKRVLKPGGRLLFVEHGLAPDPAVQRWQRRLNPAWRRIAGGCNLDRPMDRLIRSGGFRIERLHARYLPGPKPFTFFYEGTACVPA